MKIHVTLFALLALVFLTGCKEDIRNNVIPKGPEPLTESVTAPALSAKRYVFYEANPRCFATSGQLRAITERLDAIKALGTDIVWLMPIYPLGTEKAFGSPYCIKDFKGVRSECGSPDDLKSLVTAAHSKGMKVILDWVANHTAWDHPWVTAHPDWYTKDSNGNIVYPETWTDVADLNYAMADLRSAMIDAMKFWVTNYDVDGFRCDYAHGVPDDFWSSAITALRSIKPDLVMLAESDYERLYADGFDIIFSRALKAGLVNLFNGKTSPDEFMTNIYRKTVENVPAGKTKLFFITNHDDASEISPVKQFPGEKAAMSAFLLAAALDGSPLIYSSQETGYPDKINFINTTVMNWNSNPSYTDLYGLVTKNLCSFDRSAGFTSYTSGHAVWIVFGNKSYIVVNTCGDKIKVQTPEGLVVSGKINDKTPYLPLEPYAFSVVH